MGYRIPTSRPDRQVRNQRHLTEGSTTQRGYGAAWQKLCRFLAGQPGYQFCRDCEAEGVLTPRAIFDHIKPIKKGGAILDPNNIQPQCRSHHWRKTQEDIKPDTPETSN